MRLDLRMQALTMALIALCLAVPVQGQDEVFAGSNQGRERIRIAAAEFKPMGNDPELPALEAAFNTTLYSDLANAGIFELVSKSLMPQEQPGTPQELHVGTWSVAPSNAAMVAFGALVPQGGRLTVNGWLWDTHNAQSPQVLAKQYNEPASQDSARHIAHRFADEIIARLGGGLNGIAETQIYFVSSRSGTKEIWAMDYDGQNQHQITHLGSISLSPRISPDGTRLAFSSLSNQGWAIRMYSFELNRLVNYSAGAAGNNNISPAWSSDGSHLAFSSNRSGDPEIWVAEANGGNPHRVTNFVGPDIAPTWNPRSNAQIAWVSGRTGLPQIYTMDADGSSVQRLTDGGYAISPNWAPNGQFLTFSWNRKYGPGAPGGQDIYVMDIASKRWMQLTHEAGSNDYPCWAPDGRHIVFERTIGGHSEIWTMIADGTEQHQLTHSGNNFMPNWSWK